MKECAVYKASVKGWLAGNLMKKVDNNVIMISIMKYI